MNETLPRRPLLSLVCLFQSVVGVAGGATRAALTVHQARRDNMADISAKDGSQVTDVRDVLPGTHVHFQYPCTCSYIQCPASFTLTCPNVLKDFIDYLYFLQETLVNLAGLLVSLILIPLVTDNPG